VSRFPGFQNSENPKKPTFKESLTYMKLCMQDKSLLIAFLEFFVCPLKTLESLSNFDETLHAKCTQMVVQLCIRQKD